MRRLATAAAVVAVGLAVSGCGDDPPKPRASESASQSPSESASESGSPSESESPSSASEAPDQLEEPTPPAAMQGDDAAAAEAFIEYYFAMNQFASVTGKTKPLKRLSADSCRACRGFSGAVDEVYAMGGSATGGETSLANLKAFSRGALGSEAVMFGATAVLRVDEQTVKGTGDKTWDRTFPATRVTYDIEVIRTRSGRWAMGEWAVHR